MKAPRTAGALRIGIAAGLGVLLSACATTGPVESRRSPSLPDSPPVQTQPRQQPSAPAPGLPPPLPPAVVAPPTTPARPAPQPAYPSEREGRARVAGFLPPQVRDRDGWAADIFSAFAALKIPPTPDNICAAVAVIEQESTFQADPVVPGLPQIVWKEIDVRRERLHLPRLLVDTAMLKTSPDGRSYKARIDALRHEPIVTAWLAFDGPLRFPEPMIGLAGGYGQWAFDRAALGGPEGLVGVVISASGRHQQITREALEIALLEELQHAVGPLPALKWSQLITEKRATFACTPGLARPGNATPDPGLWLAGDYTASPYPATLESAIQSGTTAARSVLKACGLKEVGVLGI